MDEAGINFDEILKKGLDLKGEKVYYQKLKLKRPLAKLIWHALG